LEATEPKRAGVSALHRQDAAGIFPGALSFRPGRGGRLSGIIGFNPMKPNPLDPLFLFFGGAGCFVLLSGCLLVTLYLFAAHRPQAGAAGDSWGNDSLVMDGFFSVWLVRLLMVLVGGSLLVVASLRWAGRG
jgi:hypothetical protein